MTIAVITEKPSVARDIARVLGALGRADGYLFGNGYTVAWALGHLVALAEPHQMEPSWKAWRWDRLPMLPTEWPLCVIDETKAQFNILQRLLRHPNVEQVVCATDAGREGELIFRYIYEKAGCDKPVQRLWISSLTPAAIRRGFDTLKKGSEYNALAAAAKGRSRADWLVGMNLSRAYSLVHDEQFSVGRVQTPTLALLVERTRAIESFVPEDYLEATAVFSVPTGQYVGVYVGEDGKTRLSPKGDLAEQIVERARTGTAAVESIKKERKQWPPLLLYDLTELQRHANRLFGFTADRTLKTAQCLYEKHKVISYPRTDSRHLTRDVARNLNEIVNVIKGSYLDKLAEGTGVRPLGPRFVNDAKVSDHHAIIPTTVPADKLRPGTDEAKIYDLVCRRLLAAWQDDYVASVTTVISRVVSQDPATPDSEMVDRYRSSGTTLEREGWRVLDLSSKWTKNSSSDERYRDQTFPPGLAEGQSLAVSEPEILKKRTKPLRSFTDATLLTAMETAGKTLEDKMLSDAMRENGLGTPATRAAIIETLLAREYIVRQGKALLATDKGARLIDVVHEHVKSPAMTGQWEHRLREIERGRQGLKRFIEDIEGFVRHVVSEVDSGRGRSRGEPDSRPEEAFLGGENDRPAAQMTIPQPRERLRPRPGEDLRALLCRAFGFADFRAHQEAVCEAVTQGDDVLLVMPTGAGKSLCYQLPGIARQGTTLVVSPLIALMEDQTSALRRAGFAAERIHSGLGREASREACRRYLGGALDFLFIAPERLRVTGFPEMLAKRPPVLIAVDEAHCISHWGHDFRPDYRMLRDRLELLRAAPVIAMTATATPLVQDDIIEQLGMPRARRFIHGFRRTNIAVEVAELMPSARSEAALKLLKEPGRRPAIVYAPTRKRAEELASDFSLHFSAAAYHAGMTPAARDQVQARFLSGRLEVIVATIAFGMGIDKPDVRTVIHAALPGSIEGYYQEIGRAGRDGLPSKAVLMYSFADLKTHEFFLERDYPEPGLLERVFQGLPREKQPQERLVQTLGLDEETLGTVLEKLWIHGGADVGFDETVSRGENHWRQPYMAQREHKHEQLRLMASFAGALECRMLRLVRHFGDQEDRGEPCGQCDVCLPRESATRSTRKASRTELLQMRRLLERLVNASEQPKARLYREEFEDHLTRREYEQVVEALFRAGLIVVARDTFTKEGRVIEFQRLSITQEGCSALRKKGELERKTALTDLHSRSRRKRAGKRSGAVSKTRRSSGVATQRRAAIEPLPSPEIVAKLKEWRLYLARKNRIPAFRILTDRVLNRIAAARPTTKEELLTISGVGETILKKHGEKILSICKRAR